MISQKVKFQKVVAPKSLSTISINPPQKKYQGIQISQQLQGILLPSFLLVILGKPGSGKSHLIAELLRGETFFKNKFDRILYIGPTKYGQDFIHDKQNTCSVLDINWIQNQITKLSSWCKNLLIIFDDVVSQLPQSYRNQIQNLFYVRRHLLASGTISIIFTTQKYTSMPSWMRVCASNFISFGCNLQEIKKMKEQLNMNKDRETLLKHFQNLQKHQFLYFNLETGKVYNKNFIQL